MGLWHSTCAISQLPIREDEPARLVLLARSPQYGTGGGGYHTGHALWTPWTLPVKGVYNGYGTVVCQNDWHTEFIRSRLKSTLVPLPEGDNPFKDTPIHPDLFEADKGLEMLQKHIRNDRVFIRVDPDGKEVHPLGMCFIHEEVYTQLAEAPAFSEDRVLTAQAQIKKEQKILRETPKASLHTPEVQEAMALLEGTPLMETLKETLHNLENFKRVTESVGSYGPPGYRGIGTYRMYMTDRMMRGEAADHPDMRDAVRMYGEFIHILTHFEFLRRMWQPQTGNGSQNTGWGSHMTLSAIVNQIARREFEAETDKYEDPQQVPAPES